MSPVIWILLGAGVLGLLSGLGKHGKRTAGKDAPPVRIGHPHVMDPDEYECSACGARFRQKSMTCPACGARFAGTKTDDGELIEEMEIWDGDE